MRKQLDYADNLTRQYARHIWLWRGLLWDTSRIGKVSGKRGGMFSDESRSRSRDVRVAQFLQ